MKQTDYGTFLNKTGENLNLAKIFSHRCSITKAVFKMLQYSQENT